MKTRKNLTKKQLAALARDRKLGARKGGQAVYEKYGSQYMATIGRRGFEVTVQRHFGGSEKAAKTWLVKTGQYVIDETYRNRGWGIAKDPGPHPSRSNGANS